MVDFSNIPRPKFTWQVSAGSVLNTLIFTAGLIWAVSAFATKTSSDQISDRLNVAALGQRVGANDARVRIQEAKIVALETSIHYIRESLTRIEHAVTK